MSESIVREIDLKVVYSDLASGPAKAFHDAELKRIRQAREEQDKSDQAYVRAILKHSHAEKQLEAQKIKGIRDAGAAQVRAAKEANALIKQLAKDEAQAAKSAFRAWKEGQDQKHRQAMQDWKDEQRAAKEAARDQQRAVRDAARERDRLNRDANSLLRQAARDEAKLARDVANEKKRADRETFQQWKMGQDFRHRQAMQAFAEEKREQEEFNAGLKKMGTALGALATGAASAFADQFSKIRQDAADAAEDVMRMRGAVRELQALRDQMGKTGPGVAHVVKGAAQTLQTPEEFKQMELAGLGAGELVIGEGDGKTMTRAGFEKFMKSAGKMQAMEGGSPEAWGKMAGLVALESKDKLTPEQAEGKLNRLFEIQRPGKFATMTQAIGQYEKMGGMVSNGIMSQEEAMGLVTAEATAGNKDEAGTHALQLARAMSAGRLKSRGIKLSDDVDAEKMDEYFKGLGITDKHTVMQRAAIVSGDIAKNTGAGRENATEYLIRHGFGNAEEREAVMGYSGLKNSGKLKMIEDAQNAAPDNGAISRRFGEWRQADAFAQRRAVERLDEAATLKHGATEEPLDLALRASFARLKAQNKISGKFEEWQAVENGGLSGGIRAGVQDMLFGGYHSQVSAGAMRSLEAERKRLALPAPSFWGSGGLLPGSSHEYMLRYARTVQEGGGDVTGGVAGGTSPEMMAVLQNLDKKMGEGNALMERQLKLMEGNRNPALINPPMPRAR